MNKRASVHEMAQLLSAIRAESLVHQTHHWRTSGSSSYSDHLLFERLYNDSFSFVDAVAERTMGLGASLDMRLSTQMQWFNRAIGKINGDSDTSEDMVVTSLAAVRFVLSVIPTVRKSLKSRNTLSNGTENLLQGIEDKHEEFVYLLQQRLGVNNMV